MAALPGRRVHSLEMLRDIGVRVKAVHHVEVPGEPGRLHRQVGGAAAAEDHHVDLVLHSHSRLHRQHLHAGSENLHARRIAPGKHRRQLHVRIVLHRALHAFSQITIA